MRHFAKVNCSRHHPCPWPRFCFLNLQANFEGFVYNLLEAHQKNVTDIKSGMREILITEIDLYKLKPTAIPKLQLKI
jgi:hypothetical protein